MHNFHSTPNFYEVLHIDVTADSADMRKAYRKIALQTHPDKEGGSKEAFQEVTVAFGVLSCPCTRASYDCWLREGHAVPGDVNAAPSDTQYSCGSKRSFRHLGKERQSTKRQRRTHQSTTPGTDFQSISQLDGALESLRAALQSMDAPRRETIIQGMVPQVRSKLLVYMEHYRQAGNILRSVGVQEAAIKHHSHKVKPHIAREASVYKLSKVYGGSGPLRLKYQASIHVKALRLYTREQCSVQAAIEHQIVLVQLKQALDARSIREPEFWDDHRTVLQVCDAVLSSNETSETELGLRAWVHIRAPRWLGPRCRISSTANPLAEALKVHALLLRARDTSWESLRAEWLHLLQFQKRLSGKVAATIVDQARQATLAENLKRSLNNVERVLCERGQRVTLSNAKRKAMPPKKSDIKKSLYRNIEY